MDITGTKMRFTPWPVNANNLADQWPVVNFGSACHNSSFPTLAYSDLNNDFLRTRGSRYVAVIYRHLEVASACFMNNKYDYAFTNLPAGITKPSAVVVWGPFDPFNGQVTSKYGSGLPQWTPEVALMYIGGEDIFPNLMQLFGPTKLGFQTNDSLSLNGTAVTGYPYMTFVIGPEPVIIYNTRPVEPSAIVGPLIIGLLCVSCGLCNYGLFRLKKRYFSGPMTVSVSLKEHLSMFAWHDLTSFFSRTSAAILRTSSTKNRLRNSRKKKSTSFSPNATSKPLGTAPFAFRRWRSRRRRA